MQSSALNAQTINKLHAFIAVQMNEDIAHDLNHVLRVVKTAEQLCLQEKAIAEVVIPAAYLHDCFSFPKNHPNKKQSSSIAADKAIEFLKDINYPEQFYPAIHHAIAAHSYSANITPESLEAKIVQDADRLDALGAIGIARCIQVSVKLARPLYNANDPFCQSRAPDDNAFTIDHLYTKLFKLAKTMNTSSALIEAEIRIDYMKRFLQQLGSEIQ